MVNSNKGTKCEIGFYPKTAQRSLNALQWGLIPTGPKIPKSRTRTINARAETVDTTPSYRQAFDMRTAAFTNAEKAGATSTWKTIGTGPIELSHTWIASDGIFGEAIKMPKIALSKIQNPTANAINRPQASLRSAMAMRKTPLNPAAGINAHSVLA
jgi:SOS response associated peptidase (SRAP)